MHPAATIDTTHNPQNHAGDLSYDEYEMILAALVEGGTQGLTGHDTVNVQLLQRDQVGGQGRFFSVIIVKYHWLYMQKASGPRPKISHCP